MNIDQLLESDNSKSVLIAEAIGNSAFGKTTNKLKYLMEDELELLSARTNQMMALV